MTTIQYQIVVGKKVGRCVGPDDAELVVAVEAAALTLDPNVLFMNGKLKATGNTGLLFEALKSGRIATDLRGLVES